MPGASPFSLRLNPVRPHIQSLPIQRRTPQALGFELETSPLFNFDRALLRMTVTLYSPRVIVSWFLLVFLVFTTTALAAPAGQGNVTLRAYGDTVFASEPHGRGTVGILITCTATFIFCIWTAVYPNIVPGCIGSQRLYYKTVLMLVSIMVSEGLLICAIGNYRTARRLKNAWRRHDWSGSGGEEAKLKLDMKVAFFVGMGGSLWIR